MKKVTRTIGILIALAVGAPLFSVRAHQAVNEKVHIDRQVLEGPAGSNKAHTAPDLQNVGLDEKLGKKIPGDAVFHDEQGGVVTLGSFIDRPTLILPVYYYCPQVCGMLLANLATALNGVPLEPGKDYRVLALSVDHEDDTGAALRSKNNYFKLLKRNFPPQDWKYLTGDRKNIIAFTDAAGIRFKQTGKHEFAHPNVLVVVARDGAIIRYLYGPDFLPFDVGMAITEATRGTPSISVRKVLSYCFNYDPEKKTYGFAIVRFLVIGMLAALGTALFFLLRKRG